MSLNFPDPSSQTPSNTFSPTSSPSASTNGLTYIYDSEKWKLSSPDVFVEKAGDVMTGDLTVPNLISEGDVQTTSLNAGPLGGFRNQLINGDFRVWARSTSIVNTSTGALYTADRWTFSSFSSGSGTISRTTDAAVGFSYALEAPIEARALIQGVELNTKDDGSGSPDPFVLGSIWTFSVYCDQDLSVSTTSVNFRVAASNATGQLTAATLNWAAEGTADANGFTRYVSTFTVGAVPAAVNTFNCLSLSIPGPNLTGGVTKYSGAQLEPGPVATPFEHRPIGTEIALCQRYFLSYALGLVSSQTGVVYKSITSIARPYYVNYPVFMRVAPTVDVADLEVRTMGGYGATGLTLITPDLARNGDRGVWLGSSSANTNYNGVMTFSGSFTADAEL